MQTYPLGQQSFKSIIERGDVYIDKTHFIPLLLKNQFYFLSRPRRFGKSLLLSTLEQFFLGNKALFKGLAIENYKWKWDYYPVLRFDFTGAEYSREGNLESKIEWMLQQLEDQYGIDRFRGQASARFENLIISCVRKFGQKVVVLIDEYEKALLDAFYDNSLANSHRNILSGFYSVIKSQSDNIKMALITGITRLGHLNIFSGLNNLTDISLDEEYDTICGVTSDEIVKYLMPGVKALADKKGIDLESALALLKENYDGYHFSSRLIDVYNPYSLLTALSKRDLEFAWFMSGSSTFLLERLKEEEFDLFDLIGSKASRDDLLGMDSDMMDPISLLYQSGYLTIKQYDDKRSIYTLGLPNLEVSDALYNAIIPYYLGKKQKLNIEQRYTLCDLIETGDAQGIVDWLKKFFIRIPYQVKLLPLHDKMQRESDFQFIIYAIFALACQLGNIELEYSTSIGRIDLLLKTRKFVYLFEFKLGENVKEAADQIVKRRYAEGLSVDNRQIFKIGISFSPEERTISDYIIN